MFVRVLDAPPCVRMFSPVLEDVEADDRLLGRLNELNAEIRFARFFVLEGRVIVVAEMFVAPFVAEHVASACMQLAPQEGQRPRPLQEKSSKNSVAQSGQRMRAKPRSKMPQSRYRATTPSRRPRQEPVRRVPGLRLPVEAPGGPTGDRRGRRRPREDARGDGAHERPRRPLPGHPGHLEETASDLATSILLLYHYSE